MADADVSASATLTTADLDAMAQQVSNWGRWGAEDERGALNLITGAKLAAAAALVSEGTAVSCSLPLAVTPAVDNPMPVTHLMMRAGDVPAGAVVPGRPRLPDLASIADYFAIAPHGRANTHLDALCHISVRGKIYNGFDVSEVRSNGAHRNSIMSGKNGIVSRGVLLDIPGLRGVEWLEPGERIGRGELEAAEERQGVRVEAGDILLIAIGRDAHREAHGALSFEEGMAGLGTDCIPWLRERDIAVLGCDGFSDAIPHDVKGWPMPVHQIVLPYLGVHLIDNMQLGRLMAACRERNRWEFLLTLAPLRLEQGTASPLNPLAIF